jgi:pSer/pThr/pTyr-binding forkhead associated (FHA) protein
LAELLYQTLQRKRESRPASAIAFATKLERILTGEGDTSSQIKQMSGAAGTGIALNLSGEKEFPGTTMEVEKSQKRSKLSKFESNLEDQEADYVEIFLSGGECKVFKLGSNPLIIGRDESSDIVLDDPKASRRHARLEFDSVNYRLTDLNSTNGTFLGKVRLLPGVDEAWDPEKPLRIGDHYLRLTRRTAKSISERYQNVGTLVDLKVVAVSSGRGTIGVAAPQNNLIVEAGSKAMLPFSVVNQGGLVDFYVISIEGLPATWILALPSPFELVPGKSQEITLTIQPPRTPNSRATRYPFSLRVSSKSHPKETVEVRCALTILPFFQFTSQLQPQRLRDGEQGLVSVQNQGNIIESYQISLSDLNNELDFNPSSGMLRISEGKSDQLRFSARSKKRHLVGGEKTFSFDVTVATDSKVVNPGTAPASAQVHQGEVVSRGMLTMWMMAVLILLCLALTIAAGAALSLILNYKG